MNKMLEKNYLYKERSFLYNLKANLIQTFIIIEKNKYFKRELEDESEKFKKIIKMIDEKIEENEEINVQLRIR